MKIATDHPAMCGFATTLTAALIAAGCSAAPASSTDDEVQMKEQAIQDLQEARQTQAREAQARESMQDGPDAQVAAEELAVEMFELRPAESVRSQSGLEIRLVQAGPPWTLAFDHHGRQTNAQTSANPLYAEGVAFGHLWVAEQSGNSVQLTLRSDAPTQPLTDDEALTLARRERAARVGCDGAKEVPEARDNGTFALRVVDGSGAQGCVVVVGRFTREVVD